MARDIQDTVGKVLGSDTAQELAGKAVSHALKTFSGARSNGSGKASSLLSSDGKSPLGGARGLAAGAGAAAIAPMAVKGIGKLIRGSGSDALFAPKKLAKAPKDLAEGAASKLGDSVGDKVTGKIDEAGGPSGILKDTVKSALPFGGGGGGSKAGVDGVGKGRRMPIQQSVDIGLPIETVYNQWTQFEEWPKFMHRVKRVTQEDPCEVSFATKIWGKTKEFKAKIETQRPNERIKWRVSEGMTHSGVVTFHELGPNLTRVMLSFDVDPGSLIEKLARGARHVKRAARADLHRFKAFIEVLEQETGAWRGVIEDGEVVEDHDPSYDEQREYGSANELMEGDEDEDESDEDQDKPRSRARNGGDPGQREKRSSAAKSQSSRSRSSSGGSRGRSTGSSRSGRSSSRSSGGRSASKASSGRSSGRSSSSGRNSGGSSSSARNSGGSSSSARSSGGSSSSGRSSGKSSGGRTASKSSGSRSSGRASSSRSSSSNGSSSRSSSGNGTRASSSRSSSGSGNSGRKRRGSSSDSSRSSAAAHQGRQRARSSQRS